MLVGARALQGLGGAIVAPATLSILTTTFAEGAERNRALGFWGAMGGAGGASGALLGGVLTDLLGWQWILFVNVPIGVGAIARRPALRRGGPARHASARRHFDVAGAVTVTAGLVLSATGSCAPTSTAGARPRRSCPMALGIALLARLPAHRGPAGRAPARAAAASSARAR